MSQFATFPRSEAEEVGLSSERLLALTQAMGKAVKEGAIPGVATVVARHGHVVHTDAQGYLDIERRTPLGLDSIFRMYSQTKPVTAVLVMQLHEDGVLLLEVEDLGSGLRPGAGPRGLGLVAMRERAELVGGRVTISRPAAGGTLVSLVVPL